MKVAGRSMKAGQPPVPGAAPWRRAPRPARYRGRGRLCQIRRGQFVRGVRTCPIFYSP